MKTKTTKTTMILSEEDFLGGPQRQVEGQGELLSEESFLGVQDNKPDYKRWAANVAGVVDFVAGLPGFALGVGADLGVRTYAASAGVDRRTAAQAGVEASGRVPAEIPVLGQALVTPMGNLMKAMGYGEDYDKGDVTQALHTFTGWIEKGGDWVEKHTKGALLKEDVQTLTNILMLGIPTALATRGAAKRAGRTQAEQTRATRATYAEGEIIPEEAMMAPPEVIVPDRPAAGASRAAQLRGDMMEEIPGVEPQRAGPAPLSRSEQLGTFHIGTEEGILSRAEQLAKSVDKETAAKIAAAGGVAAYIAANPEDAVDAGLVGAAMLAVKGKGGMWHPEAVSRLSEPLFGNRFHGFTREDLRLGEGMHEPGYKEAKAQADWSDRAIRNYLNKYAGTESDPLRDVDIPHGQGTLRWETVWDRAIRPRKFEGAGLVGDTHVRPGETIYELHRAEGGVHGPTRANTDAVSAVGDYLSHVGDYLRQNVPPEKLQNYDLVRAVRETAQNDARVAKEMEKAAAASTKGLPVHKEYPDGFRWVELKEPKELTPEQAKSVRLATPEEYADMDRHAGGLGAGGFDLPPPESLYLALDSKGQPIRNSYTEMLAGDGTPTRAWLAGRLAEEGNQMGHCVGGYCDPVASGESRIFSLRDKEGRSHVTIEAAPKFKPGTNPAHVAPEAVDTMDIQQIKGKQNLAPNAEYIPYVQDFVKSGEWGQVRDIQNAQMTRFRGQFLTYDEARKVVAEERGNPDVERLVQQYPQLLREQPELGPRRGQAGTIDPQLLKALAGIGLGGLVGSQLSKDPVYGALLGALAGGVLAGTAAGRNRLQGALETLDKTGGLISTRLQNKSPELHKRLLDSERHVLTRSHTLLNRALPWMLQVTKLPPEQLAALDEAIFMKDSNAINVMNRANPGLAEGWQKVRGVLNELGTEAQGRGRFRTMIEEYFPQRVRDFKGLKNALDQPIRTRLEEAIARAEQQADKEHRPFTDAERDAIINRELRNSFIPAGWQPGYARPRRIKEVTEQIRKFYHSPSEALYTTVLEAVKDLETAKMFGKDVVNAERGGRTYTDVNASVGNVVGRELAEGRIKQADVPELESILKARFGPGERAASSGMQALKNIGYMTTIGDVLAAGTQLGDPVMAFYNSGMRSTLTAMARVVSGNKKVSAKDFGLADHIAEELAGGRAPVERTKLAKTLLTTGGVAVGATAGALYGEDVPSTIAGGIAGGYAGLAAAVGTSRALQKVFKHSGFAFVDRFGKDVQLNAALDKYQRLAQTPAGRKQITDKYGAAYKEELPELLRDLQSKQITEPVNSLLFAELSRMQPITKLEASQLYLERPNARIAWQLKSWMLKQADIVRRDAFNEIKQGNRAKGLERLATFTVVLGISGAAPQLLKDWLMGKNTEESLNNLPITVWENALKTFGWSNYTVDKIAQGQSVPALAGLVLPPWQVMNNVVAGEPKAAMHIPVIGKLYENWELGGRDRRERADKQRRSREELRGMDSEARREHRRLQRILEGSTIQ